MMQPTIVVVALAVLAIGSTAQAGGPCPFTFPVPQFYVGAPPRSVAAGDLNGDGIADMVASKDGTAGEIAVVLSNGDGTFAPAVALPVGAGPCTVAIAKLNADLFPDIIVGVRDDGSVVPFLNDGAGGFTPGTPLVLGTDVFHICAGDVDGDDLDDVIVTQLGDKRVTVCHSDGLGGLVEGIGATFTYGPYGAALGDVDNDGRLDLAIVEPNAPNPLEGVGVLYFYFNNGTDMGDWQGFGPLPLTTPTSPFPERVLLVNVDGIPGAEAVVSCNQFSAETGRLDVMSDAPGGLFMNIDTYVTGESAPDSAVGDLNDDGFPDIVTVSSVSDDIISVLLNEGDGTFAAPVPYDAPGNHLFLSIALGDIDGDGDPDPVVGGISGGAITAFVNRGDGTFSLPLGFPVGNFPTAVSVVDLNKDGSLDTVAGNNSATLSIALGAGDGSFGPTTDHAVGSPQGRVVVGDFDGDTWLDIVAFDGVTPSILLNDQADGFVPGPGQSPVPLAEIIQGVDAGFLDGDANLDLAVVFYVDSFPFNRLRILLGDGAGGFTLGETRNLGTNAGMIRAVNVDADADTDLIVLRPYISDGITVLYNDGSAGFAAATNFPAADPVMNSLGSISMTCTDLNDDGYVDVATVNSFEASISVLLNDGAGSFVTLPRCFPGVRAFCIDAADVTGDDIVDLVVGVNQGSTIFYPSFYAAGVFDGIGDGTYLDPRFYALSVGGPWSIATGDVNDDGRCDIVPAMASLGRVDVLLNGECLIPAEPCPGEADGSGVVNFADILSVLANFNAVCP